MQCDPEPDLEWHPVARFEDLPTDGSGLSIPVAGRQIALFRVGDGLHALDDSCPHRGGSLGLGIVARGDVTCPWHGFHFDLETGCNTDGVGDRVRVRHVRRTAEGAVEIGLPHGPVRGAPPEVAPGSTPGPRCQ